MSWTKTRSEIATTLQHHPHADVTELRRRLKAERLEEHIRSIVDSAPPLSDEQRARLMLLLAPRGGDHERPPDMRRAGREARSPEADLPQDHPITAHDSSEWMINGDLAEIVVLLSQCASIRAYQAGLEAVAAHSDNPHIHRYVHVLIAAVRRD